MFVIYQFTLYMNATRLRHRRKRKTSGHCLKVKRRDVTQESSEYHERMLTLSNENMFQ